MIFSSWIRIAEYLLFYCLFVILINEAVNCDTLSPTPYAMNPEGGSPRPTPFASNPVFFTETLSPTPYAMNPVVGSPRPTPFASNPAFLTETPTGSPTPLEWRFAAPTPFFLNPKFYTPMPTSFPTPQPTPFDSNPLFMSTPPTPIPTQSPTTSWPTPAVGFIKDCYSISSNDDNQINRIYNNQLSSSGLQGFHITYYGEYKIITVTNYQKETTTYVLYLCNYPSQETLDKLGHIHPRMIIQIPIATMGFTNTLVSHAIELLGMNSVLKASCLPLQWNTSPCINQLANMGTIVEAYNWDSYSYDNDKLEVATIGLVFATFQEVDDGLYNGIEIITSWYNSTALQSAVSLMSFLSVFFNQEGKANEIIRNMKSNYHCSSSFAKSQVNSNKIKKVLWCDYGGKHNSNEGGDPNKNLEDQDGTGEDIWACKTCPGPECSLVKDAGGKLLDYTDFGDSTINVNGVEYLESTEFMEMAVFADIWISHDISSNTEPTDFNDTITYLLEEQKENPPTNTLPLAEVPAVKNNKIYDFNLRGYYASRQEMYCEPDAVLQDVITILGTGTHKINWIRNVFSEEIGATSLSSCIGNPFNIISSKAETCSLSSPTRLPTTNSYANDNSGKSESSSGDSASNDNTKMEALTGAVILLSIVVATGIIAFLGKVYYDRNQTVRNVDAVAALGKEAKKMTMDTVKKKTSKSKQKYTPAPDDSKHGT